MRFVNRQSGSGTRLLFDLLLSRAGVDTRAIEGYEILEYTHAAVAAYVGSGMADAGFGLEVPARRFGLDFVPLVTERYFFLCRNEFLADPAMQQFECGAARCAFRAQVAQLPGYDPSRSRRQGARAQRVSGAGAIATQDRRRRVDSRAARDCCRSADDGQSHNAAIVIRT